VNLRRAKAMADEMGMSMEDLTNTAVAAMERTQASTELMSRGFNIDEKDREFLMNLARMEGGQMVISIPENLQKQFQGTEVALSEMTDTQAKMILDQRAAFKELSIEDYARQQTTALENISRDISFIRAAIRVGIGQTLGEALENYVGELYNIIPEQSKQFRNSLYNIGEQRGLVTGMLGGISQDEMMKQVAQLRAENAETKRLITSENIKGEKLSTSKTETPVTTTNKSEVTINIKSADSFMEPIKRNLWNDPAFSNTLKGEYIESLSSGK